MNFALFPFATSSRHLHFLSTFAAAAMSPFFAHMIQNSITSCNFRMLLTALDRGKIRGFIGLQDCSAK